MNMPTPLCCKQSEMLSPHIVSPMKIMADFEKAIINACQQVYPGVELTCGFFHLGQSVYRQVQALGLQQAYNDPDNETIRVYTHAMLALAYVPEAEVGLLFQLLSDNPNLYDTAF